MLKVSLTLTLDYVPIAIAMVYWEIKIYITYSYIFLYIQVPEKTAEVLIDEGFSCQYKGITQVKGKQPMTTYFVLYQSTHLW